MSWQEKLLFFVLAFQAAVLIAWVALMKRENDENKKKDAKQKIH